MKALNKATEIQKQQFINQVKNVFKIQDKFGNVIDQDSFIKHIWYEDTICEIIFLQDKWKLLIVSTKEIIDIPNGKELIQLTVGELLNFFREENFNM